MQLEMEAVWTRKEVHRARGQAAQVMQEAWDAAGHSAAAAERDWRSGAGAGGRSQGARMAELQARVEVLEQDKAAMLKELEISREAPPPAPIPLVPPPASLYLARRAALGAISGARGPGGS
jgi:hypothetical protein